MRRMLATPLILALAFASLPLPALAQPADAFDHGKWQSVGLCAGGGLFNPVVSPHDPKLVMTESDMGGRYLSLDGGHTWAMLHFQQLGAACRGAPPLFHPTQKGTIYALEGHAAADLHVSRDNGKTWQRLPNDRQPRAGLIRAMLMTPGGLWAIGAETGKVMLTPDEGKTWTEARGVEGGVIGFVYVEPRGDGPPPGIVVGTGKGVFVSDDAGKTFVRRTAGLPEGKAITGFAGGANLINGTVLYVCTTTWVENDKLAGGMYVSTDTGKTWKRAMNPDIDVTTKQSSPWAGTIPAYSHLVANSVNPRRAYVYCRGTSYFPPNHSAIYRTDDAGASWKSVWFVDPRFKECNVGADWMTSFMHQSWVGRPLDMNISSNDPDTVMRADGMFLHVTNDAGKSWFPAYAVKATDTDKDADLFWKHNNLVNTTTWHYYVDPHQAKRHYIAYTDIGFARSLDGGQTWRWWGPGPRATEDREAFPIPREWTNTTYELAMDPDVPGRMWGAFSGHHDIPNENSIWRGTGKSRAKGGVAVSDDFGVTWKTRMNGLPEAPTLSVILDPTSPKDKRTLYAAVYDHGVFKSADGGASWTKKSKGLGDPEDMRVVRVVRHADGTLLCLITGMRQAANGPFKTKGVGLYRSADAGESWALVNKDYPLLYPRDFGVDPADSKVILIGASDTPGGPAAGGLHMTADGGKTWKRVLRKRTTHFGAYFHPSRKGWIYATCCGWSDAPEGSLFLSTDAGKTWQPFPYLPFAQINRVDFNPNDPDVIYCSTFGGSIWKGPAKPGK